MAINTHKYREHLLAAREQAKQEITGRTELPRTLPDDGVLDSADRSVQEHAMDLEGRLISMRSDRLQQINAALQRLDHGVYGLCVKCRKEIDPRRLDAEPTALTCMDCLPAAQQGFSAPTL
jgi:DnaK suppressor protein